ncbi:MAG TPA: hypothetical protein VLE53_05550 [Gemmatimonadaceae bacterium]|nr:hypothetical protein [Gemmatimonadaceae bacterium]
MMRLRSVLLVAAFTSLAGAGASIASQQAPRRFPHQQHERLFPVCEGCHAGVLDGVSEERYPRPADCAECHDGTRKRRVNWQPPGPRASNLLFTHASHREATDRAGEVPPCQSCHSVDAEATRMDVGAPQPERCLECHAHRNPIHLSSEAACRQCHVPLAGATRLTSARIASFPRPPWHDSADFPFTHGREEAPRAASCAVCHARETCDRCHANADRVPLIAALTPDARVAELEKGRGPAYPVPASHGDASWTETHGTGARSAPESCANCHTQPSCLGCHGDGTGVARRAIGALPAATSRATGVSASRMARTPHASDIAERHGSLAATGKPECTQCHASRFCSSCHMGSDSRAFHAANYVERHAVDVFTARADCQTCHNTERFCRDCHTQTGVASQGRMNAAFHNAQPSWVLSHGQAARAGLEACASCHRQSDCTRCHSAAGGWGVNPHGRDFAASRRSARASATCRLCHLGNPGGGP